MTDTYRALCAELVELSAPTDSIPQLAERLQKLSELASRARAALAQPVAPTNEELDDLFVSIDEGASALNWRTYARAVLAKWGTPTIQPVPVSERLPGPEDCDGDGRCWMFGYVEGDWRLISATNSGIPKLKYCFTHWLPHHALPTPEATNA
jgi:hypothetical protein